VCASLACRVCAEDGRPKDIRPCTTRLWMLTEHEEPSRHWPIPRSRRGGDFGYGGSNERGSLSAVAPGALQRFVRLLMSSNTRGLPDFSSCWAPDSVRRSAGLGVSHLPSKKHRETFSGKRDPVPPAQGLRRYRDVSTPHEVWGLSFRLSSFTLFRSRPFTDGTRGVSRPFPRV